MVKVARSKEGLVDLLFGRGATRSVPVTTEALPLTWIPKRIALAKLGVCLMADALKRLGNILVVVVVVFGFVDISVLVDYFQFTLAFQRWSLM